jgi:plastocyanin
MRKLALLVAVATLGALGSSGVSLAQTGPDETVEILGGTTITPGESIQNDWRYDAATITVAPNDRVAWVNNTADEDAPHTITLVRESKLPDDFAAMEACYAPGQPCASALNRHGGGKNRKNVVEDDADNERGLDEPRDSRWVGVNKTFTARISAGDGATLYYLCALHPWMQGQINVEAP